MTILRTPSILLCRRLVLLCCAVLVVSLLASAEAESAVTRAEVRWSWSSNPSGGPPLLRALTPRGGATAGCWPVGAVVLGPCPDPAQAGWEGRDLDPQGNPRTIAYVDRSSDQRREYEFEVYIPCVPPCGELTVWGTIGNADGSTKRVPPFTLGQPSRHTYIGSDRFGISAGRAPKLGRRKGARSCGKKPCAGTYKGRTTAASPANSGDRTVKLKVTRSPDRLSVRGPHEYCGGFNRLSPFYGRIEGLKISRRGEFKGERAYQERLEGARSHPSTGTLLDVVLDWHIKVSGSFVSSRTAKGKISYELRHRLEDNANPGVGWDPPGPDGPQEFGSCGKRSGTWQAKHQ